MMSKVSEDKINKLVDKIEKQTNVRFSVDEIQSENEYGETEYSYSLYLDVKFLKFYIMEESSGEAVIAYLSGVMAGVDYAYEKQFKTICQN